jgi:phosphoglycerate dehydrogenase-like enzyme
MKLVLMLRSKDDAIMKLDGDFSDVEFLRASSADDLHDVVEDCEVLVASGSIYSAEVADILRQRGGSLRWIQSRSVGVDMFVAAGVPKGVIFTNARGINGRTESEHAIALLLALMRRVPELERCRAEASWRSVEDREQFLSLEGRTLVIVGMGSIGQQVARKAGAFDMRVIAVTRTGDAVEATDESVSADRMIDVLPGADAVVMCLPLNDRTRGLLGEGELAVMKPSAVIVNVARGGVVDQHALTVALRDGRLGGAGLDVFENEPLPADNPLWRLENVILSPHVAGAGGNNTRRFVELFADNLRRYRAGGPLRNQINLT